MSPLLTITVLINCHLDLLIKALDGGDHLKERQPGGDHKDELHIFINQVLPLDDVNLLLADVLEDALVNGLTVADDDKAAQGDVSGSIVAGAGQADAVGEGGGEENSGEDDDQVVEDDGAPVDAVLVGVAAPEEVEHRSQ